MITKMSGSRAENTNLEKTNRGQIDHILTQYPYKCGVYEIWQSGPWLVSEFKAFTRRRPARQD